MTKPPSIAEATPSAPDLALLLEQVQARLAELSSRLERLEAAATARTPGPAAAPGAEPAPAALASPPAPTPAAAPGPSITAEEMLAVSAALAAYLGVRLRIRQIRLLSSPAWAQQGRVSIQASHQLHG